MTSGVKGRSLWPVVMLLICVHLSATLYTLPLNRVIERRLCQEYYQHQAPHRTHPADSIPEKLCKIDSVQRRLAWMQGVMETTMVLCDFIVTVPFSFVADKWGVRVVLLCNLVPRAFMSAWAVAVGRYSGFFSTKSILIGPFMNLFGGECVFQSTIFTLTSALTQDHVERATYFSYISSTTYVVSFIGPSLAAFTMSKSLWLPFGINIILLALAVPMIRLLPNKHSTSIPARPTSPSEDLHEEADPLLNSPDGNTPSLYASAFKIPPSPLQTMVQSIRKLIGLVVDRRNFQILLLSFFLTALASSDTKLLVQYISKRYEWTFAEAGYMLSMKAIINFFLLAIFIPRMLRASTSTQSTQSPEIRLYYLGAQASIAISVVGVLCIALAFKIWMLLGALLLYALGSALPVFTMSLVKSPLIALPPSHNNGATTDVQDFSIVMLTKTLGSLVGAPLMAFLWVLAIKLGGAGVGLPYFVSACIYSVAAVVVAQLRF